MLRSHTEKWGNFESLINCKLPVFHCLFNGAHYVLQFIALRRRWTLIVCHFQRFRGKRPLILDWYRSVVCHPSECRQVYTLHESAKTDMGTNLQWKKSKHTNSTIWKQFIQMQIRFFSSTMLQTISAFHVACDAYPSKT